MSFLLGSSSNFTMDSCSVSNGNGEGLYVSKSISSYDHTHVDVKSTNFTQVKRPLYVEASTVNVIMSQFNDNVCAGSDCVTIRARAGRFVNFHANLVQDNSANQILATDNYDDDGEYKVDIIGNIFRDNAVPVSTSGSSAILYMKGSFQFTGSSDGNDSSIFDVHSNEFSNIFSLYEMSSAGVDAGSSFKINATNNYFTVSNEANISASIIDDRLFDDDEDDGSPEILFQPYLTNDIPFACPSNCTENGLCVFPGVCICKDGWSGASCDSPTCATLDFCSGNGECR